MEILLCRKTIIRTPTRRKRNASVSVHILGEQRNARMLLTQQTHLLLKFLTCLSGKLDSGQNKSHRFQKLKHA